MRNYQELEEYMHDLFRRSGEVLSEDGTLLRFSRVTPLEERGNLVFMPPKTDALGFSPSNPTEETFLEELDTFYRSERSLALDHSFSFIKGNEPYSFIHIYRGSKILATKRKIHQQITEGFEGIPGRIPPSSVGLRLIRNQEEGQETYEFEANLRFPLGYFSVTITPQGEFSPLRYTGHRKEDFLDEIFGEFDRLATFGEYALEECVRLLEEKK